MYGRVHTSLDIIICSHAIDTIKNNDMFVSFDNDDMVCGHIHKIFVLQWFLFGVPFILYCWIVAFVVCIPARLIICFWMYHPCCLEGEDLDRAMRDGVF